MVVMERERAHVPGSVVQIPLGSRGSGQGQLLDKCKAALAHCCRAYMYGSVAKADKAMRPCYMMCLRQIIRTGFLPTQTYKSACPLPHYSTTRHDTQPAWWLQAPAMASHAHAQRMLLGMRATLSEQQDRAACSYRQVPHRAMLMLPGRMQ